MKGVFLSRVNGRGDHHAQRAQQLDYCSENEPLSLLEPEELQDEDEEADAAEDGGQDHRGLDRLQVGCFGSMAVLHRVAGGVTGVPQVSIDHIPSTRRHHPPSVVDGGDEEEHVGSHMEEDDEG